MDSKRKAELEDRDVPVKRIKSGSQAPLSVCIEDGVQREGIAQAPLSGSQKSPNEERNVFSELAKWRTSPVISGPPKSPEIGCIPQAVPSLLQDTAVYVETNIQPSPKDSGIDMSSPERKLEDLGGLSSQESSPRIVDPTIQVHTDKDLHQSKPKYAAIGNFAAEGPMSYLSGKDKDLKMLDSNMNNAEGQACSNVQCEKVQDVHRVSSSGEDITGAEDGSSHETNCVQVAQCTSEGEEFGEPPAIIVSPAQKQINQSHSNTVLSTTEDLCVDAPSKADMNNKKFNEAEDRVVGNTECTLTQLNMSQKSTETDLRSLADKKTVLSSDKSEGATSDFEAFENEECLEDDLFASLNDESVCSFTANGTPNKKLYLTPQSTPRHRIGAKDRSPTISKSTCSTKGPSATGFMSEFTKFLQQSNTTAAEDSDSSQDIQPLGQQFISHKSSSPPPVQQTSSAGHLYTSDGASGSHTVQRPVPIKAVQQNRVPRKPHYQIKSNVVSQRAQHRGTEARSSWTTCTKQKLSKPVNFKVARYMKQQNKVLSLRQEVIKLLNTLFPDLDYPLCTNRTLNTADILLDQVIYCVKERRRPPKKVQVIATDSSEVMDVRIVVCKSPLACLRALRRKVCHFLEAVLPGLDLGWPFDRTGEDVEDLMQEVILCNQQSS